MKKLWNWIKDSNRYKHLLYGVLKSFTLTDELKIIKILD